jgi:hypothetical protein
MNNRNALSLWRQATGITSLFKVSPEEIAARAYVKSLQRQGSGRELDDWLEAERELLMEKWSVA